MDHASPSRRTFKLWITLSGVIVAAALCVGVGIAWLGSTTDASQHATVSNPPSAAVASDSEAVAEQVAAASAAPTAFEAESMPSEEAARPAADPVIAGKLGRGETLAQSLSDRNIGPQIVNRIAREMGGHFDFRYSHAGDSYRLVLDEAGEVESFRYRITSLVHYDLIRHPDGTFDVARVEAKLTPRQTMVAGVVTSSLYGAITDLGAGPQLANDFANVFAYDVDFARMVKPGDEFRILYERLYRTQDDGTETFVKPGRILAARYAGRGGEHTALYFESGEGHGGYYRPDGSAVARSFLMAPLKYSRISSSYSAARRHPILKITRPHHGIDYAAAHGTPVYAVASGEVIQKSWAGGYGNLVKIRHSNGYTSYYGHLSRFASGLRNGQNVGQRQVIGYVGSTGLSTGPHVCFRVAKNGSFVNPAQIPSPAGPPLAAELMPPFRSHRDILLAALDSGTLVARDEAL